MTGGLGGLRAVVANQDVGIAMEVRFWSTTEDTAYLQLASRFHSTCCAHA